MKKLKIALIIICSVGCTFFVLLSLPTPSRIAPKSPTKNNTSLRKQEPVKQPEVSYSLPVRLKIPKINVDAAIEPMGLTSEGYMQAPSKPQNAGWYKFGSHPGNKGSAVVAGHYGLSSKNAVFNQLRTLSQGDVVQVIDAKGAIATFAVSKLKTYDKNAVAPEVFKADDEKAHLNLVTCKGAWQKAQQTYSDRLVVFADSK